MSDLQKTINDIARGLYKTEIIELKTLTELKVSNASVAPTLCFLQVI